MSSFKKPQLSIPDIPYSTQQVLKNINYFNSCGLHVYSEALRKYYDHLMKYKSIHDHSNYSQRPYNVPVYPQLSQSQKTITSKPKEYKRPYLYQGVRS